MLLLGLLVPLVYAEVSRFSFVAFDDGGYTFNNPRVSQGLSLANVSWAFTTFDHSNWHPLTWLSHMLDVWLFGMNPGPHHLVNVLFHLVNTLLLFVVLFRMTGGLWESFFTAAFFGIHPLHAESVAWVSERKDVVSGFFFLLCLLAYGSYVENRSWKTYLPVFVSMGLGLMAKPMLVTLPFVLLLLDFWPLGRIPGSISRESPGRPTALPWRELIREKTPLVALSLASCVITLIVQRDTTSNIDYPVGARISNALVAYLLYLVKTVWPVGLAAFYPHPASTGVVIPVWQAWGAALFLILVTAGGVAMRRRAPFLLWGWLFYLGTLLPVIGLVQVGAQAMADRYTYIPLIGVFVMVAWGISATALKARLDRRAPAVVGILVLVLLALVCRQQVSTWRNSVVLFEHALAVTSNNWLVHNNLASEMQDAGRFDEAIRHYRHAVWARPDYAQAHKNLAVLLFTRGVSEEAERHFIEALRIDSRDATALNDYGVFLLGRGRIDDAIHQLREAARLDPGYSAARYNLANALMKGGMHDEAIAEYRAALKIRPDDPAAHNNLGYHLLGLGRRDEAILHFREALRLSPGDPVATGNLAAALSKAKGKH